MLYCTDVGSYLYLVIREVPDFMDVPLALSPHVAIDPAWKMSRQT